MTEDQYIVIGRLKKTYGNDGAIRFTIFDDFEEDIKKANHFFLHLDGIYVPFFFQKNAFVESIFRLKGIDSLEKTEELASKPMFLRASELSPKKNKEELLKFSYLTGFKLFNQNDQEVGQIIKIEAYPMQELATLDNGSIIPMSEELILNVSIEQKTLQMELIEGLLGL